MVKEERPLSTREVRQQEAQFRVMQAIAENPNVTQRQIASLLSISLGRANYCLASLIQAGSVKVGNCRRASDKLNYACI
jgi:DNA-binding MarR family transcriptional regulator